MILSAQTIRKLCLEQKMIEPFIERQVINGRSAGLSSCSYDCRIKQNVVLYPKHMIGHYIDNEDDQPTFIKPTASSALVSTIERFNIPNNVCGFVVDKSSYARLFLTAFNTLLDSSWTGFLTVELVNLGPDIIKIESGEPICQIVFQYLDQPTELQYSGKYNNQPDRPVEALFEK